MVWLLHTNMSLSGRGLTGISGRQADHRVVKTKITTESLGADSLTCLDLSSELELRPPGEETIMRANCEILQQESFQKAPSSHLLWIIFTQTYLSFPISYFPTHILVFSLSYCGLYVLTQNSLLSTASLFQLLTL